MRRIVFLDFDGVIMTNSTYARAPLDPIDPDASYTDAELRERVTANARRLMDERLVRNVSELCSRAGADLVLSTSWRGPTLGESAEIVGALRRAGLSSEVEVIGVTPWSADADGTSEDRYPSGHRGMEIRAWLDQERPGWRPEDVLALDDDPNAGSKEGVSDRWIETSFGRGFDVECLTEALARWGLKPERV